MRSDPVDQALRNIERMIDRDPLLRDILHPSMPTATRRNKLVPAVDVVETDGGWVVLMELAGVAKDAVSVRLDGARLTIRGEKPAHRDGRTQVAERDVGAFTREFLIPYQVDAERIVARLEDGLLRVTLPRLGEGSGRDVEVQG